MTRLMFLGALALAGGLPAADYVIKAANGTTVTSDVINTADRVVIEAGTGTVVLQDGNTFGTEVVVSNGYLVADYAASGLGNTHLTLVGTANNRPAILRPKGPSFTAPVAASGAGTISLVAFCGFAPYDQPLTVNLGGQGATLQKFVDGFLKDGNAEFDLMSKDFDLTFENGIDMNGKSIALKNPSSANKTYFKGRLLNSQTTGTLQYWDGTMVFSGEPGREDITWKKNCKFVPRCGNVVFTNCKLRPHNDMTAGFSDVPSTLTLTYGPGCDHYADNAWDTFAARRGSKMVVDGGVYDHNLILFLGNNDDNAERLGLEGNLVITNNGTVKLGTFALHHGSVNQHSGLFSVPNDGKHGDGNEVRIGGWRAASTPQKGRGTSVYNLWDGTFEVSSRVWMHIGSAETGTFNQFGGVASEFHPLLVGYHANGNGTLNVHGGVFNQTRTDERALRVGVSGVGSFSVANGGRFAGAASEGVEVAAGAAARGQVSLDPLGVLETTRVYGGSGTSALTFNGGTLKAAGTKHAANFVHASLGGACVTPLGGAVDTAGKGNFTIARPLTASNGRMTHRWTFAQCALTDTVGGSDAVAVGGVVPADGSVTLPGGKAGTSQLKLGTNLVPTTHGWTCEMWFTQKSLQNYSRLFQCGLTKDATSFFVSTRNNDSGGWYMSFAGPEIKGRYLPQNNIPYHLSVTMEPLETGAWTFIAVLRNAETGEAYETLTSTSATTWSPAQLKQSDGFWIGNGPWGDPDPGIVVHEIRMHGQALSQALLAASARWGAHGHFFAKKGAGTLTLTGANTYAAGTAVEAGTLKLAADASLPATPVKVAAGATLDLNGAAQTVASLAGAGTVKGGSLVVDGAVMPGGADGVGTLTLDGAVLKAAKLLVDVAADGTCDAVVGTGTVDLSDLVIEMANPEDADPACGYQVLRATSVTGRLAGTVLPRRWVAVVSATGVRLVQGGGTAVLVR